ncbi:L-type lectin-like domain-containing protein [Entamoeba marina]
MVFVFLLLFACSQADLLSAPFSLKNWTLSGNAEIFQNSITLTRDAKDKRGMLVYNKKILSDHFQIDTKIKIHNEKKTSTPFGDGMALWLVQDRLSEGIALGGGDKWNGLGVFIDTYANQKTKQPTIQLLMNNGIGVYNPSNDGSDLTVSGCYLKDIRNAVQELSITYDKDTISVSVNKDHCATIHRQLPKGLTFGVTAQTGGVSEFHKVISVQVTDTTPQTKHKPKKLFNKNIAIPQITKEFTALEMGRTPLNNIKQIAEAFKEADQSILITQQFVQLRSEKIREVLKILKNTPHGLERQPILDWIEKETSKYEELFTLYSSQIERARELLEKVHFDSQVVIGELSWLDIILFINAMLMSGVLLYHVFRRSSSKNLFN